MNRYILTCISFFLFAPDFLPQNSIIFNHLTIKEGLSQSSVTCILQDKKGFMWFGTQDGLNRFDGYNFKIFKNDPSDTSSLSDNFIFSISETPDGVLYIKTQGGKINRYFPQSESFKQINEDSINLIKARTSTIEAVLTEPSGIEWSGGLSRETGLKKINTRTGKTVLYMHNPSDPSSLSSDKVYSILRDRSGNLWIATFNGLDRFDENTGEFIHYRNDPENSESLPDNWVWSIYQDSHDNLWIGTVKAGLCKFNPVKGSFINYRNDPNDPSSINDNFIFSICEDRGGVLWIGTNLGGINFFHPSTQIFEHYKHDPAKINSLNDNIVNCILVDKKSNYWIGTRYGGLNKFNYNQKKFTVFRNIPGSQNTIISNSIQTLYQDKTGIIWIGTYESGLDAFNPEEGTFIHYVNNPDDPFSLSDNRIYSLTEDSDGNIWIGTYGGGLNKFDKKTGRFIRYKSIKDNINSLSSNAAWSMEFDNSGNLWIGTFGGGLNKFNIAKGKFTHFKNIPGDEKSIPDNNVVRIFKDSKGNIWIGTTNGLSFFDSKTGFFRNYNEKQGLANNSVYGILEDKKGNLWISTNNGVSKFNPGSGIFKNFYYENGLQGNEFNQNAFAKDNITGRFLFGGPNGFNVFHPDNIRDNDFIPPVEFTNYIRYNTDDEEGKPIYEKGISEKDSILLTYKDNIVTIDFAALSFYNIQQNRYRYQLEGFNKNWIQLGNKHSITFTNLSPGQYTLTVIGSNNDGIWNERGKSVFIEVTPPWWRTNLAYAFYGLIFISIILGARKIENDRKEQKAKIRESELRIKASEAEKRAIQIENDRKTQELEEARQLQLSMLPRELPKLQNLEIAAFMRTATEVGGDYYDFIVEENGALNVAFGDATGHGLQAGTMVTLMKGFFTSDAARFELQEFMNHCSRTIKEIKLGHILMSFTFLKIKEGVLKVTSAGMPPLYYFNSKTGETEEILIKGMPLGAMKKFKYELIEKQINKGDSILLVSDGLAEQMNHNEEMFNYNRIKSLFNDAASCDPKTIIQKLTEAGDKWMEGVSQIDDMTFVVIRVK